MAQVAEQSTLLGCLTGGKYFKDLCDGWTGSRRNPRQREPHQLLYYVCASCPQRRNCSHAAVQPCRHAATRQERLAPCLDRDFSAACEMAGWLTDGPWVCRKLNGHDQQALLPKPRDESSPHAVFVNLPPIGQEAIDFFLSITSVFAVARSAAGLVHFDLANVFQLAKWECLRAWLSMPTQSGNTQNLQVTNATECIPAGRVLSKSGVARAPHAT